MKFHGIYMQDDRDIRDERRRQKLEPAFTLHDPGPPPGRRLHARAMAQARRARPATYGGDTDPPDHPPDLPVPLGDEGGRCAPTIQGLHDVLLDTIAACGDDTRGVMCAADPRHLGAARRGRRARQARSATTSSPRPAPITRSGTARSGWRPREPEEPFYGQHLPAAEIQDRLRDAAVERHRRLHPGPRLHRDRRQGRRSRASTSRSAAAWAAPTTSPRPTRGSADVVGFIAEGPGARRRRRGDGRPARLRQPRRRAPARGSSTRSTTRASTGSRREIERRLGEPFEPARPFDFTSNGDQFGWHESDDGRAELHACSSRTAGSRTCRAAHHGRAARHRPRPQGRVPADPEPERDHRRRRAGGPPGDRCAARRARPRDEQRRRARCG